MNNEKEIWSIESASSAYNIMYKINDGNYLKLIGMIDGTSSIVATVQNNCLQRIASNQYICRQTGAHCKRV